MPRATAITIGYLVLHYLIVSISATILCTPGNPVQGDSFCAENYREGSICSQDGTCSNPFRSGCLKAVLSEQTQFRNLLRTCNSRDDPSARANGECLDTGNVFEFYNEVRILGQNWEAPMLTSWVLQIMLSEFLGVPTTLESGKPESEASIDFYDPLLRFSYGETYDFKALENAVEHGGDCKAFQANQEQNGTYQSCAHYMPEVWSGSSQTIKDLKKAGIVEYFGAGGVSKYSWYVPKFTAERNFNLLTHFGLTSGTEQEKRRRLADTFLRPQTWKAYCDDISEDQCASPKYENNTSSNATGTTTGKLIVARPPQDESEEGLYFKSGLFHGYFHASEDNDCDANPLTCTGHIAMPPCDYTNYVIPQAHHLGIPVKSSGPMEPAGNYDYSQMIQIYSAANYTKSNLIFYWFAPDPIVQDYFGTDAEFTPILLPQPSKSCIEARVSPAQRCSNDPNEWYGEKEGACDSEAHAYKKVLVSNLYNWTHQNDINSPAYDFLTRFRINVLELEDIFDRWYAIDPDRSSYAAREAVCTWVGDNLELLKSYIPDTFPRSIRVRTYEQPAVKGAMGLSIVAAILVIAMAALVFHYRKEKVMIYAQPVFMGMLLLGLLLVSVGAFLKTLPPSYGLCMLEPWFVMLGQSLMIFPLIVKVTAINSLFEHASRMRRIKISTKKLYLSVGVCIGLVAIFLAVWNIVDPLEDQISKIRTHEPNEYDGELIEIDHYCSSNSRVWYIVLFIFGFFLLFAATLLAIQNRNVKAEFNEAVQLGHMIYAHFLFELLIVIVWILGPDNLRFVTADVEAAIRSFLLSTDIIISLFIYFLPKVCAVGKQPEFTSRNTRISTRTSDGQFWIAEAE